MIRKSTQLPRAVALMLMLLLTALFAGTAAAGNGPAPATYQVTLENLTFGQPLSPPVFVTHRPAIHLFQVGEDASDAIEAIAEDGNASPAVEALTGARHVTDILVGAPIAPIGTRSDLPTSRTYEITAAPGNRLSLATMLICTNDGFAGVDSLKLPRHGEVTIYLNAYDAGTEDNTELSADIVDPCSFLGPVDLDGDPNGNENDLVNTDPAESIQAHPNVQVVGDLLAAHGWDGPIAKLTITRID